MYIESISFSKKPINGIGWEIKECAFNKINLIAGQNASGKTRLLRAIDFLVKILLDNKQVIQLGFNLRWKISLKGKENTYIYELEMQDNIIIFEKLLKNNELYFERNSEGKGEIKYEPEKDVKLKFEIEKNKIVLSTKRDKTQNPSLEDLFEWMNSVYMYNFGDTLGRNISVSPLNRINDDAYLAKINRDDNAVVLKFERGLEQHGQQFTNEIIKDFNSIGYSIDDIATTKMNTQEEFKLKRIMEKIAIPMSKIPSILYIKERNIQDKIPQQDISQGMFRVLSLIIQIKYLEYALDSDTTILIDDIGEGLDYERANKLIKYVINKVEKLEDNIQLIMTTNDRFTMNSVPLEYWIIINKQKNGKINFYTKKTHQECFEDFEDIGLNNFDFFAGEYYKNCVGIK